MTLRNIIGTLLCFAAAVGIWGLGLGECADMDAIERYELKALVFYRMTGMLAPGKDAPSANPGPPFEERQEAWDKWNQEHGDVMCHAVAAFDELFSREAD